jgi:SulP family sulfate permease
MHTDHPPLIVDVREPREYKAGHIPTAVSIPLPEILGNPTQIDPNQKVTFVCRSGRRSTRVASRLVRLGYNKVRVLKGGILAWEAANLLEAVDFNQSREEAKKA